MEIMKTKVNTAKIDSLTVIFDNQPGFTFYTFPKSHFASDDHIKNLYQSKIDYIEQFKTHRKLTHSETFELKNLKHHISFDPRYRDVCYGTMQDAVYAIEAATNLDDCSDEELMEPNSYLCDWFASYPFESTCRVETPVFKEEIIKIVERKRTAQPKTIYSDYHFLPDMKIEILPGDQISESTGLLVPADRLIIVARPIGTKDIGNRLRGEFADEFKSRVIGDHNTIEVSLAESVRAFNTSFLTYMGNPELAPESGAMLLAVYIDPVSTVTFVQVGPIKLKQKIEKHYEVQTADHTFNNAEERYRAPIAGLRTCFKINSLGLETGFIHEADVIEEDMPLVLLPDIPSRFLGHPSWCLIDERENPPMISATPFIKTIRQ